MHFSPPSTPTEKKSVPASKACGHLLDKECRIAVLKEIENLVVSRSYMKIALIKPSEENKAQLIEMLDEWKHDVETNHTNPSPRRIFRYDHHDFTNYLEQLDDKEPVPAGRVPTTTLFCYDYDKNIFVGAVNIRHYLDEGLLHSGGHIGDGIRPSERRKGYATAMIALALKECKKLGIERVLMCCRKDNIGSAKSIINNGGILENEVLDEDNVLTQRYWINL